MGILPLGGGRLESSRGRFHKEHQCGKLLQASWKCGHHRKSIYSSLSLLSQLSYFRYNFNNQTVSGYAPTNVPNPDLGWEKTFQVDVGADVGLFNNRVDLVFDYYYKKTTDLLLSAIVPGTSGLAVGGLINSGQQAAVYQNLGAVENRGFEVGINTQNTTGEFKWNTILVFSSNRNKVIDIGEGITRIVPNTQCAVGY